MGYLKEKYTKEYVLREDKDGNPGKVGIVGIEEFKEGDIRLADKTVLTRINFNNHNVLEFGFGRGEAIKFALDNGAGKVVGVDFSEHSHAVASEFLKTYNLQAILSCEDALDFLKRQKKSEPKFDIVIMFDFVEHVPRKELEEILQLLHKLLSPKGILAINTPVFKADNDVVKEGLKEEAREESDEYEATAGTHCNRYTKQSLRDFMKRCGFGAISGHFFGRGFERVIEDKKKLWEEALKDKYPIFGDWQEEEFEYALTSEELWYKEKKMTIDLLLSFVGEGDTFIDIGHGKGDYSLACAKNISKESIYAFESRADDCKVFKGKSANNNLKDIKIYNIAVSDEGGKKVFNVTEASDSSGFYEHPLTKTREKRKVDVTSIDEFMSKKSVDVVKMDTEGHELHVLEGMEKIIKANKNIKLFIEFNPGCLENANTKPEELLNKLVVLGFDIYFIHDNERKINRLTDIKTWKRFMGNKEYRNIICIKKENSLLVSFISHCSEKDGAERSLLDIIDYFIDQNILVHVILPSSGPLEEELKKRPVAYDILHFPWWINTPKKLLNNNFKEITRTATELAKALECINPHIIYSNSSVSSVGSLAAAMIKKPHIWHITEFGLSEHGINYNLEERVRKTFINNYSDKIIFTSNALKKDYEGFIDSKKAEVVYNFAEAEKSVKAKKDKYFNNTKSLKILVLGSIQQGKNQKEALLALNELTKGSQTKDIELIIVGKIVSQEYYNEIKKFIDINKLDRKVKLISYIDEPYSLMEEADIILVCSRNEAFGRVTIEAFNLSKPVIGASSGATTEIIQDNINGFLYTPGDYKELAKKISYFFDNRNELLNFGKRAHALAKRNFGKDKTLSKIYNLVMKINKDMDNNNLSPEHLVLNEMFVIQKDQAKENNSIKTENEQLRKEDHIKGDHIKSLEKIVKQKDDEITKMKSSKLWKTREFIARANRKLR